jgi:lipopolysaccharide/colanic/teichoic acid biosynthesis glycosyltransferase
MKKRLFDILVACVGLVMLLPFFLVVSVLIKLDSDGPVFFRGVRTGRFGRPFRIFKFRTMIKDADKLGGGSTGRDDPRITRVGHLLRKSKLDEIPQLINVMLGEMSIVGPRPELPQYTEMYDPSEQVILSVAPGITDYASIEFVRLGEILGNDAPDQVYEDYVKPRKNALRVIYAREHSFTGDFRIILRTLEAIVRPPHGANQIKQ